MVNKTSTEKNENIKNRIDTRGKYNIGIQRQKKKHRRNKRNKDRKRKINRKNN